MKPIGSDFSYRLYMKGYKEFLMYTEESYISVFESISGKFRTKEKKENGFINILGLYFKSLKPFYVEELLVFFLYRPLSFLLAFPLFKLSVSPNVITVLRAIAGMSAGIFLAQGTPDYLFIGAIILFISNIFDCTDGQLARMRGTSSWIGTTLDAIADGTTTFAVYLGTAVSLSVSMPESTGFWWFLSSLAVLSMLIHINSFGFFRYEYIHYTIENYPEELKTVKELKGDYFKAKKAKESIGKRILILFNFAYVAPIEFLINIFLPKGYKGYKRWYLDNQDTAFSVKSVFRKNYKQFNQRILQGFGTISMVSNLSVFVICGILGRLDIALYTIIFGFNGFFLILIIIQRLSLKHQLRAARLLSRQMILQARAVS